MSVLHPMTKVMSENLGCIVDTPKLSTLPKWDECQFRVNGTLAQDWKLLSSSEPGCKGGEEIVPNFRSGHPKLALF